MQSPGTPHAPGYFRASFGLKGAIAGDLTRDYHSDVIPWMKENGFRLCAGVYEFHLAKEFGFCYGVEKAIDLAYEARRHFPDRRIFLTHEIIHNPRVNTRLHEMGIQLLSETGDPTPKDIESVQPEDVVILPAFGTSTQLLEQLKTRNCVLVDTTCGSVVHVWKRVERYARDGFTSLIHGKYYHEETIATVSRAQSHGGATLVVRNLDEADLVCDVIRGKVGTSSPALMKLMKTGASPGFNPERDLQRIGVANQTTMLASESLEVARRVGIALKDRYGEADADQRFRSFDTICSATQERQDAIIDLARQGVDLLLIVGGYNSSNTGHLCAIAAQYCRAFHIDDAREMISADELRHRRPGDGEIVIERDWLVPGPLHIGVTAGASTPNRVIGETIARFLEITGTPMPDLKRAGAAAESGAAPVHP